jgi:hypothetical protein
LQARSPDEEIVVGTLLDEQNDLFPDAIVYVADASNLKRNLFLFSQVADIGLPTLLVLTMTDVAEGMGIHTDVAALSVQLGVPVVLVNPRNGADLDQIIAHIDAAFGTAAADSEAISLPKGFYAPQTDALDFRAASDTNVAAADLENLHDEEEEGEEEGGKDTRSSMFRSFSPLSGARLAWGICRRGAVGAEPIKSQAALYRLQCEGHQVSQPAGQAAERDGQMQELVRAQHRRGRRWLAGPNLFSPPARDDT